MPTIQEETNRILLGKVVLQAAVPAGVPALAAGVAANLYTVDDQIVNEREIRRMRFRMVELVLDFTPGAVTAITVVPYLSRVNPAPTDRSPAPGEAEADSWHTAGGIPMLAVGALAGGDTTEIAPRGAAFIYLRGLNAVGGAVGDVEAWVYGILSGPGGGW